MAEGTAAVWICDLCAHVWLKGEKTPTHCASCKSRRWNDSAKTPKNRPALKMPQWSDEKLRELAKAEDGAFVGVGATPYNLAVLDVIKASASAPRVQPATGYPGHADGCACFRCRAHRQP